MNHIINFFILSFLIYIIIIILIDLKHLFLFRMINYEDVINLILMFKLIKEKQGSFIIIP